MYTSIFYAEPQVLFQDGVYWRLLYQLAARGDPLFRKKANGNQYVFASRHIQITHVWVQLALILQRVIAFMSHGIHCSNVVCDRYRHVMMMWQLLLLVFS